MSELRGGFQPDPDGDFDRAMRACHAEAVSHLSARTQAQLRQRLRAAMAPPPSRRHGWRLATAALLVVGLAGGLYWQSSILPSATPPPPVVASEPADGGGLVAVIDETPDLYLWLASDDADRLASE
ncbi:hypothetical protein [Cognatiluteimonas profundi]|uniref:hypothetical protein n=1 Tax=Cognatiluteimonas profundi TaxID=2594501 RepID=UPI00131E957A|nr:hypothetical protein [Lysobacter profundi]